MSTWSLIDTINLISVFFLVFFSYFLLTHKKGKRVSNRILGLFLLTMAFVLLNFILSRENRLPSSFLIVFLSINAFSFLMGPVLYFYVRSVVYRDFGWRKGHLVHTIPPALYLISLVAVAAMDSPLSRQHRQSSDELFWRCRHADLHGHYFSAASLLPGCVLWGAAILSCQAKKLLIFIG